MNEIVDGVFDVQVDTEYTEGTVELDVHRVLDGPDGRTTLLDVPVARVAVEAHGFEYNGFIETTETDRIAALPEHVRDAYALAVDIATNRVN